MGTFTFRQTGTHSRRTPEGQSYVDPVFGCTVTRVPTPRVINPGGCIGERRDFLRNERFLGLTNSGLYLTAPGSCTHPSNRWPRACWPDNHWDVPCRY